MSETLELLFFDTFSHENSEELNLDLVQFPKTVFISEVRIIPLGARVQADFPGGVRLGATNPTQFDIEFFVNDLSKPGASSFESLGEIKYNQNGSIHLECDSRQIPTDGLVLRGWYTTITLAVYGALTKALLQEAVVAGGGVPVHPDTRTAPPDIIMGPGCPPNVAATAEWVQQHAQVGGEMVPPVDHGYMGEPSRDDHYGSPYPDEPYHSFQDDWPTDAQGGHGDGYQGPKEDYEGEVIPSWGGGDDKMHWDRMKDHDRELRHHGECNYRDRSRDRSPVDYNTGGNGGGRVYGGRGGPPPHRKLPSSSWLGGVADWEKRPPRTPPPASPHTPPMVSPPSTLKREVATPPAAFDSLSPGDVESISEGEIPEPEGTEGEGRAGGSTPRMMSTPPPQPLLDSVDEPSADAEQFEPILSDEEIGDDCEQQFQDIDYDFNEYPEDPFKMLNPYNFELSPLVSMADPSLSCMEWQEVTRPGRRCEVPEGRQLDDLLEVVVGDREEWVHAAEQVAGMLDKALPHVTDQQDTLKKLLAWVDMGLNFERALSQPQPGYKVRHIKAGVRLVEAVCQCGEQWTLRAIDKSRIHCKLIDLFHQDYMALSIKLMILRSLDSSLRYKSAVLKFLHDDTGGEAWRGYQKLLEMVKGKQLARVRFAISSLLQKLHFFEILEWLGVAVKVLEVTNDKKGTNILETVELPKEFDTDMVVVALEEIVKFQQEAPMLMTHPKRFLPVSAQFEIDMVSYPDPYPAVYSYFRCCRLLESCLALLSHPVTACNPSLCVPIYEIMSSMMDAITGLIFLASQADVINQIIRLLLGTPASNDDAEDGVLGLNPPLGLHLVSRLQALKCIDSLEELMVRDVKQPDVTAVLDNLQTMFYMTFSSVGKASVVHILSRGDSMGTLLKLLKQKPERESKIKRSPGRSYIADLIIMTVKHSDQFSFLHKYAKDILEIISKGISLELSELVMWLMPVEKPSLITYDNISSLCEIIKKNVENAVLLPGDLITAVRVLKHLGIPPRERDLAGNSGNYQELKYKSVILQLFSCDGVSHLIAILQNLCEHYEQPALHSARLMGRLGITLTSFVQPAIQLLRRMLTYVIRCRNTELKDTSAIPVLLLTYNLMQVIPVTALCHAQSQRICRDIIEILLAYTQPVSDEGSSETEALNKSLWTLMLSEVLKFTVNKPLNFFCGLLVLSELLPLPLPLYSRNSLTDDEVIRTVNARKLWSAHLHSLHSNIHDMVVTMSGSCYQPLLQLLRRVCVQLADLAAPTALVVTRALIDSILTHATLPNQPADTHAARLLNFFACLVTHASIKASAVYLITMRSTNRAGKSEERYPDLVPLLCQVLRTCSTAPSHIQSQECIVSIVQTLCDTEISLLPPPTMALGIYGLLPSAVSPTVEAYLANSLPPRQLLITLCQALLDHVSNADHSLSTLLPAIRTFTMLTEHDYGFYHFKSCMEKQSSPLWGVLVRLSGSRGPWSHDCLAALLELVRSCLEAGGGADMGELPPRSLLLTTSELARSLLSWPLEGSGDDKHPLYAIEKALQECYTEEEVLENLLESLTELIRLLEEEGNKSVEVKEVTEPVLPAPDPLLVQFSVRPIFMLGDVEPERLTTLYWLSAPLIDEADNDAEQVTCDLMEVARSDLPDLALAERVAQLCRHKTMPGDLEYSAGKKRLGPSLATEPNTRRPFIAPMRGRGFRNSGGGGSGGGGGNSSSGAQGRGDMFRSRPPNTSRPPSLHVDDFVALETCGQQPTGPTGYNKLSMRAAQDMMATRSRGRGRSSSFGPERGSGARFVGTTSPYRRENNRGSPRGSVSPFWHAHGSENSAGQTAADSGQFRWVPELRNMCRQGDIGGGFAWTGKEQSPGGHRGGEQHRHARFFSR